MGTACPKIRFDARFDFVEERDVLETPRHEVPVEMSIDHFENVAVELRKLGARIEERPDGFVVEGPTPLVGAQVNSHGDHRLAMSLAIAGLLAEGETTIGGAECIVDSFPGFEETLRALSTL